MYVTSQYNINCICWYIYTVPMNQLMVTDMQSDDNQSRQDDERNQVENNNGLYMNV